MNKSSIIIALLAAILAMSTSCRSAQKAMVSETRSGKIAESVEADWSNSAFNPLTVAAAAPEWTDFSASGNITVSTTGSLSSAIQIKMVRGRSISISIRPLLGIEMGKLFVDKDSVTLVDKYHNIYVRESVSQSLGNGIGLYALQNLLLSRPFDLTDGAISASNAYHFSATAPDNERRWQMRPAKANQLFGYFFDMIENNVSRFNVTLNNGQQYAMDFSAFKPVDGKVIATSISAHIEIGGTKVGMDLKYTKSIRWNSGVTDYIRIPDGARRYSLAQLLKSI